MYKFENVMKQKTNLKNRLKIKRFEYGEITQDDLARRLEVSRQTINAIENDKFNPSVKLVLNGKIF